jgi:DNA processing protein
MSPRLDDAVARARAAAGHSDDDGAVAAVVARLTALAVRAACAGDDDYPAPLAALADPPAAWFVRGEISPDARMVAIVGSRSASPYGCAFATRLAGDLAALGHPIVSGLARGIDAAAHEGALAAGGCTIAIVPGGLDAIVPRHHHALAERIARHGAIASERASGPPRHGWEFVERNRLIAALAEVTVVVEAAQRSGALSTAAAARRLGRPVLAVPGDLDRPEAAGTLALLRAGARPCGSAADVIAALGPPGTRAPVPVRARTRAAVDVPRPDARRSLPGDPLLGALEPRPVALEILRARSGLALGELLAGLLRLEWAGLAHRHPGGRWSGALRRGGA